MLLLAACTQPAQEPGVGSTRSSYDLGVDAYVAKQYDEAAQHWERAIAEGHFDARNNLGYLLFRGLGVEQDQARAIALWRESAMAGHSESAWHLGQAYDRGDVVTRDAVEAYAWYRCALASSAARQSMQTRDVESRIAADVRDSIADLMPRLSASDLERAERRAAELVAEYALEPR